MEKIQSENNTAPVQEQPLPADKPAEVLARCCGKLPCYDWLADIPESHDATDLVEVQFKNTRKGYYRNSVGLRLQKGDVVAVEGTPGHDIGVVSLTGRLVLLQMRKNGVKTDSADLKRVYRKAKATDLEKYKEAKGREHSTMLRARKIAEELHLNMKIGDVEYQGDGNKAIFYYIADDRVDFRQLIKVLAEVFRVRIEMKQIGARQEAGRIGGIGPCGRELCCSSWMSSFVSVATSAARFQDISLNPQRLAGQCAKLKCCLNYEVDAYVEGQKHLPSKEIPLETLTGTFYLVKTDIFKRQLTYSSSKDGGANLEVIDANRAFEIISLNKRGIKPETLSVPTGKEEVRKEFGDVVGQDSVTRFDRKGRSNNGNRRKHHRSRSDDSAPRGAEGQTASPEREAQTADNRPSQQRGEGSSRQPNNRRPDRNGRPPFRPDRRREGRERQPKETPSSNSSSANPASEKKNE
ncbi:MAG: hypothetical protein LUC18_05365 [Porphyromonadaceae bacterium]|nr:hypothetical protein [Porphyromonadaceae bacterium]